MDDKTFEMLEKIYSEVLNANKKVDDTNKRLDSIEKEVNRLGAVIDGDVATKVSALFDGYKVSIENDKSLDEKLDKLQMDVNNITIKTASNDNKIIELSRNLKEVK